MRLLVNNKANATNTTVNGEIGSFPKRYMFENQFVTKTFFTNTIDIDLGSAQNITAIACYGTDSSYTVKAGTTASVTDYSNTVTDVLFLDETYRYWQISKTGDGYINHLYLGEFLAMPGATHGATPQRVASDVVNTTSGGQKYVTNGHIIKTLSLSFPGATRAEWLAFNDWFESTDRINSFIFVQFENTTSTFPPFFARIPPDGYTGLSRVQGEAYIFNLIIQEAK